MTHEPPSEDPRPTKIAKTDLPSTRATQAQANVPLSSPPAVRNSNEDLTNVPLAVYVSRLTSPIPLDPSTISEASTTPLSGEKLAFFHDAVTKKKAVCVLLAAGQGSRFKSDTPKVIHPFAGKPLAQHALDAAAEASIPVVLIVGYAKERVVPALKIANDHSVAFISQDEQMGTGHAVYLARGALPPNYDGAILVSYADNPGIDGKLMADLLARHKNESDSMGDHYGAMILTGSRSHAGQAAEGYGRIVRKEKDGGRVVDIVEKKTIAKMTDDGTTKEYDSVVWTAKELDEIDEYNSGIVCARAKPYLDVLGNIVASQTKVNPPKYEYYATDFVKGLNNARKYAEGHLLSPELMWRLEGTNTVEELQELERKITGKEAEKNADSQPASGGEMG